MTRRISTIAPDYFDALYQAEADPWRFATSDYEGDKYRATLEALGRPRYRHALEIGCSIGVFTRQLATRCDAVLAIDASDVALDRARSSAKLPNVTFEVRMVPAAFPEGEYELIVLSEVLYYLDRNDLATLAGQCAASLSADGEIILCHWLGETDYPLTGEEASDLFVAAVGRRLPNHRILHDDVYRLDRLGTL